MGDRSAVRRAADETEVAEIAVLLPPQQAGRLFAKPPRRSPVVPDGRVHRGGRMRETRTLLTGSSLVLAVALALPVTASAQAGKSAGVVTTLQGEALVTRVSTTQPAPLTLPLKFKEDVYAQDRVTTGDRSLVRILLGGKAVVTVREHSALTITETPDAATVSVSAGTIALAVAKERMRPGERIDVRTPNAVAGVRGTVLITEVTETQTPLGPQADSRFTLITGVVDVSLLDPTGRRTGSPFTLNALQTLGVTGFTLPSGARNITRAQAQSIANSFRANLKEPPTGSTQLITERHVEQVTNTSTVSGGTGGGGGVSDPFKTLVSQTITNPATRTVSGDDTRNGSNHNPATQATAAPPPPPPPPSCDCLTEGRSASRIFGTRR
ncbi:MAG TPA: FecR domain-containing protein [Methylomirabilota bacterium]|nr:FecR domain-containing protein [Methylomirabilota bacterium]